jgi:tryptophanyl-tRNA synthetase
MSDKKIILSGIQPSGSITLEINLAPLQTWVITKDKTVVLMYIWLQTYTSHNKQEPKY